MKKLAGLLILLLSVAAWAGDRSSEVDRVESSATVLDEIMAAPDKGIPERIIDSAKCIAVVPSMLKGGFVVGASYGRGIASCRTERGWTSPAFFVVEGGSFGFQIGGQAADVVMLVMNDNGVRNLLSSKFKLGADAAVAAGPVGRQASGDTDITMRAEILTYSRSRGIFAGLTLNGASVRQDRDATRDFYGRMISYRTLLKGEGTSPEDAKPWITALNRYAGGSTTDTAAAATTSDDSTTHVVPPPPPPQTTSNSSQQPTESAIAPSPENTPPAAKTPADNNPPSATAPSQDPQ
jgi:lipid-binding SYLF domain-containing protein